MLEILHQILALILLLILAGFTFYYRSFKVLVIVGLGLLSVTAGSTNTDLWVSISRDILSGLLVFVLVDYMRLNHYIHNYDFFKQLAAIVESADLAIIGKDLTGEIVSWNKAAEKLYGYTQEEAIGADIHILLPDDHEDDMIQILKKISQGEIVETYQTERKRKDGKVIPVVITVSPVKNPTGKIIGASIIAHPDMKRIL